MADDALEEVVEAMARATYDVVWARPGTIGNAVHWDALRPQFLDAARRSLVAADALGFKLTGREPLPQMTEAGRWPAEDDGSVACWQAMWDAAPSTRETEGGER